MATDRQRILQSITAYSALLCPEEYEVFKLADDSNLWNHELLSKTEMRHLYALHRSLTEKRKEIINSGNKVQPELHKSEGIKTTVKATSSLPFEIKFWENSYDFKYDNTAYSQLVAYHITMSSLKNALKRGQEELKAGKPLSEGMTKTEFTKIKSTVDLLHNYLMEQIVIVREQMVSAQAAQRREKKKKPSAIAKVKKPELKVVSSLADIPKQSKQ